MKLSTVDIAPLSALTVLYKGSFTFQRYTYTVHIADVEASKSEEEGREESEEQDLCDQFNDIYDDPTKSGKSGGVDIEEEMDALATSSSESPVQPVRHSKHAVTHHIESSTSSSTSFSCYRLSSKDTLTSDSLLSSWKSPEFESDGNEAR